MFALNDKKMVECEFNYCPQLQKKGLLPATKQCERPDCGKTITLISARKRTSDASDSTLTMRCKCKKYHSIYEGTFFSLSRKRLYIQMEIIKYWASQI